MNFEQTKKTLVKKRRLIAAGIGVLLLVIILIFVIVASTRPTRSVASFCSAYKQENARLAKNSGDTYSLHPFTHDSSNPYDFVVALSNLDAVAPKEIEPDVKTLKLLFEKIDKDPSQAFSASMSGLSAESNLSDWTCGSAVKDGLELQSVRLTHIFLLENVSTCVCRQKQVREYSCTRLGHLSQSLYQYQAACRR